MLVLPLVVLLAACYRVSTDIEISSDDTITGEYQFLYRDDVVQSNPLLYGSDTLISGAKGNLSSMPSSADAEYEEVSEDGFSGFKVILTDVPLEDFTALIDSSASGAFSIERIGDEFSVTGSVDLSTDFSGTDTGTDSEFDSSLTDARVAIDLCFPGEVTDSTGDVDGNCVSWLVEGGDVKSIEATAQAEGDGGSKSTTTKKDNDKDDEESTTTKKGDKTKSTKKADSDKSSKDEESSSTPLIIGGAVAALLVLGAVLFFVLKGKKKGPGAPDAGMPAAAPGAAPSWGTPPPMAAPSAPDAPTQTWAAPPVAPPAPPAPPAGGGMTPPPPPPPPAP